MVDRYAVIGSKSAVEASLSPKVHALFAQQTDQQIEYASIPATLENFPDIIKQVIASGMRGVNITSPFKEAAYEIANIHDRFSLRSQVANTLDFKHGNVKSYATDGQGLVSDLKDKRVELDEKKVLILGAGGVTSAIVHSLLESKVRKIVIASNNISRGLKVGRTDLTKKTVFNFYHLLEPGFDIIINTRLPRADTGVPKDFPKEVLRGAFCYDINYTKDLPFFDLAVKYGRAVSDGLGMLVHQAAESFYIWRKVMPETQPVINYLTKQREF